MMSAHRLHAECAVRKFVGLSLWGSPIAVYRDGTAWAGVRNAG